MENTANKKNDVLKFNAEELDMIRKSISFTISDNDFKSFIYQAERTGLNPLLRQIYCIQRGNKVTVQTSIDGFRVVAERTGDYAGQSEPIFEDKEGNPVKCTLTVFRFRGEQRYPAAVSVAYMKEYNAGGPMWGRMPHTMLAKVTEALALRKAYPQDLSGLYTGDEMAQADEPEPVKTVQITKEAPVSAMAEKMNPFKRKYDTAGKCSKALADTREIKEVASLYYVNAEMIEATQDLKAEFTTRKNELYNSQLLNNISADDSDMDYKEELRLVIESIGGFTTNDALYKYWKELPEHIQKIRDVSAAHEDKTKQLAKAVPQKV